MPQKANSQGVIARGLTGIASTGDGLPRDQHEIGKEAARQGSVEKNIIGDQGVPDIEVFSPYPIPGLPPTPEPNPTPEPQGNSILNVRF